MRGNREYPTGKNLTHRFPLVDDQSSGPSSRRFPSFSLFKRATGSTRLVIVARLSDETGAAVQSEKTLEIVFVGSRAVRAGDQFGIGRRSEADDVSGESGFPR
jgi:hypothetical protein